MSSSRAVCTVEEARCTLCGLCVEACACHSVALGEHAPVFHCPESCDPAAAATCPSCGCLCEEVCPTGAIRCSFEIVLAEGKTQSVTREA